MGQVRGPAGDVARLQSLLLQRAEVEWLQGEAILAVAPVRHLLQGRYRVRGLDHDGNTPPAVVDQVLDAVTDSYHPNGYTVVRGDHPDCSAVALYRAAGRENAWLVVTSRRVAVLRMRDVRNDAETVFDEVEAQAQAQAQVQHDRSLGGLLRGAGKLVGATAVELARSLRRPPLADRPGDAVLECPFQLPAAHLHRITPWKPRLLPNLRHGPRYVQVHLADGSSASLETDAEGASALTGDEPRQR
jgi:hypothetical protein